MASDPISTLGPSDSGFLNAFLSPQMSQPLQSRVGEGPTDHESVLESDPIDDETVIDDSADEAVLDVDQIGETQMDALLLATPLPDGMLARLRRIADETQPDKAEPTGG